MRRGGARLDADLDEAWRLACRFGEPIRLMPVAAALVERAWLLEPRPDDRAARPARAPATVGLEWARGDLAVWLRRLDPGTDPGATSTTSPSPTGSSWPGSTAAPAALWADAVVPVRTGPRPRGLRRPPTSARAGLDELDRLGADRGGGEGPAGPAPRRDDRVPRPPARTTPANPAGLTDPASSRSCASWARVSPTPSSPSASSSPPRPSTTTSPRSWPSSRSPTAGTPCAGGRARHPAGGTGVHAVRGEVLPCEARAEHRQVGDPSGRSGVRVGLLLDHEARVFEGPAARPRRHWSCRRGPT